MRSLQRSCFDQTTQATAMGHHIANVSIRIMGISGKHLMLRLSFERKYDDLQLERWGIGSVSAIVLGTVERCDAMIEKLMCGNQ